MGIVVSEDMHVNQHLSAADAVRQLKKHAKWTIAGGYISQEQTLFVLGFL